jgi:dipeptidyl aminopeptidase/acylaminoacyl peptidase
MRSILFFIMLCSIVATACAKPPPKTIEALRESKPDVSLKLVGRVDGGPGFSASLYQYVSAGLKVHALVARPLAPEPEGGWPVVIANHGHHPNPRKHGITEDGNDWRPGDYYRRIPELFVARGYLVVMPDYRGHSSSEGFEFTEGMLESAYYTEDVLNLLAGLHDIDGINADELFMWGHSTGGEVTLRALLVSKQIKAASMWSSVGGDIWDQSYYYSRASDPTAPDSSETKKNIVTQLRDRIADLDGAFDYDSVEPYLYLADLDTPVIIQHAVDDTGAAYKWSQRLAKELFILGKTYEFWSVPGDAHLFDDEQMEVAADRDVAFFRSVAR